VRTIDQIRKDHKPIVFLGSSWNVQNLIELCNSSGREVLGLIDPDYEGQSTFKNVPVLDKEKFFSRKNEFEFFVATWWAPFQTDVHRREIQKRKMFIDWMQELDLVGATVVHASAVVSPQAKIDRHVSVGALSVLISNCEIHSHSNVREQCYVSHDVVIESNCVLQMKATVTGSIHIGHDTYVGPAATMVNGRPSEPMHIGSHVVVHPNQLVVNSVPDNTIVSYKKASFSIG